MEENNYFFNLKVYANISCNLLNNRTFHKITFLWIIHGLERLHLNENAWAGFLVTLCDSSKGKFSAVLLLRWCVCTEHVVSFHLKCRYKTLQKWNQHPCSLHHQHSLASSSSTVSTHPHTQAHAWNFWSWDGVSYIRKGDLWKHSVHLPAHKAWRPVLFWAHQPEPREAEECSSQPLPVPHWSQRRRSDLGEFSAGNCSGSLALSSRYPSGLPAMMTALLPLNFLTEHEGWLQLAPVQGRARRACTTKICGSSAIDSEGCSTKSLGAAPCITNLRNSLWFPLRAIRERYIVLCLELKMLVSNTDPKLNHRIHLIFVYGQSLLK